MKVLELSEREKTDVNEFDDHKEEFSLDVVRDLQISRHFYNTLYNSVTDLMENLMVWSLRSFYVL